MADKERIIHVSVEILALLAICTYIHNKDNNNKKQFEEIKKEIEELKEFKKSSTNILNYIISRDPNIKQKHNNAVKKIKKIKIKEDISESEDIGESDNEKEKLKEKKEKERKRKEKEKKEKKITESDKKNIEELEE